jgi:hypothetical protein
VIYSEIRRRDRRNSRFWFGALLAGAIASLAAAVLDVSPPIEALFVLIGFAGIFGFLAFLSTRNSLLACIDDVFDRR